VTQLNACYHALSEDKSIPLIGCRMLILDTNFVLYVLLILPTRPGVRYNCPSNKLAPNTQVCNETVDVCDAGKAYCTGRSAKCPGNYKKSTTVCFTPDPEAYPCAANTTCTGKSSKCPTGMVFKPNTKECRPPTGPCTQPTLCTGASPDCPTWDLPSANGTQCTDDVNSCEGTCDGTTTDCQCPI
jgi:hypothetical protein